MELGPRSDWQRAMPASEATAGVPKEPCGWFVLSEVASPAAERRRYRLGCIYRENATATVGFVSTSGLFVDLLREVVRAADLL